MIGRYKTLKSSGINRIYACEITMLIYLTCFDGESHSVLVILSVQKAGLVIVKLIVC